MDNTSLRRQMRQRRHSLTPKQQRQLSRAMAHRLMHNGFFRAGKHIACYLAQGGEIDPQYIIEKIWLQKKRCYLPVLDTPYAHHMAFAPYRRNSKMTRNCFSIPEPRAARKQLRKGRQLDLVLLPLVAFDRLGNRLGMGGGFYDRTFAFINRHRRWHKPKLVGLAYEFQKTDELEHRPWDVPLDAVVTDQRVYYFSRVA